MFWNCFVSGKWFWMKHDSRLVPARNPAFLCWFCLIWNCLDLVRFFDQLWLWMKLFVCQVQWNLIMRNFCFLGFTNSRWNLKFSVLMMSAIVPLVALNSLIFVESPFFFFLVGDYAWQLFPVEWWISVNISFFFCGWWSNLLNWTTFVENLQPRCFGIILAFLFLVLFWLWCNFEKFFHFSCFLCWIFEPCKLGWTCNRIYWWFLFLFVSLWMKFSPIDFFSWTPCLKWPAPPPPGFVSDQFLEIAGWLIFFF